jgi:hypothetical protein
MARYEAADAMMKPDVDNSMKGLLGGHRDVPN